jgi:hypothetical protein
MSGNTIFLTYRLIPTGNTIGMGYQPPIHCNYVKKIQATAENPLITEINMVFPFIDDFKFLTDYVSDGSGYTMNCIHAVVQVVDNTPFDTIADVKPDGAAWKYTNISDQITGYAGVLTASGLTNQVFKLSLYNYNNEHSGAALFSGYTLNYLDYPSTTQTDELCFGDVTYFFGNVTSQIKADVYTTDLSINLPLQEFNSTTNPTWNGLEKVYVSEIGLYDSNKNLVAIAKLNDPVAKDATIARTIVFALDF